MNSTHQYAKAPITEALIDIQAKLTPGAKPAAFEALAAAEAGNYPKKSNILQGAFRLQVGPGVQGSSSSHKLLGVRISDPEQKQLVQLRVNGFTMSRLNPYQGWHKLQPEAKRLWTLYKEALHPTEVTRVAVRFINRIDLPNDVTDLEQYITTVPRLGQGLHSSIDQFFMQLQLPQNDLKAMLVLTEARAQGPADKLSILLDIDVFRDNEIPQDEDGLWQLLERFHVRKNEIFEASITEETRSLINE
jgi:uncharacterized protein (TIGR04255 family)